MALEATGRFIGAGVADAGAGTRAAAAGHALPAARGRSVVMFTQDRQLDRRTSSGYLVGRTAHRDEILTRGVEDGDVKAVRPRLLVVGRLDDVTLSRIEKTRVDGKTRIKYHAKLPVAWGSKTNLPTTYKFALLNALNHLLNCVANISRLPA